MKSDRKLWVASTTLLTLLNTVACVPIFYMETHQTETGTSQTERVIASTTWAPVSSNPSVTTTGTAGPVPYTSSAETILFQRASGERYTAPIPSDQTRAVTSTRTPVPQRSTQNTSLTQKAQANHLSNHHTCRRNQIVNDLLMSETPPQAVRPLLQTDCRTRQNQKSRTTPYLYPE